jgi:hypothetical protein
LQIWRKKKTLKLAEQQMKFSLAHYYGGCSIKWSLRKKAAINELPETIYHSGCTYKVMSWCSDLDVNPAGYHEQIIQIPDHWAPQHVASVVGSHQECE